MDLEDIHPVPAISCRWVSKSLPECGKKNLKQLIVELGQHKAEADKLIVQEGEGGAIPNHKALPDGCLKEIHGADILP